MSIKLRPATWDDAQDLLQWKNDPVVRRFSLVTKDEILWEDHVKWLEKHLNEIFIIEDGGNKCGDIRLEGDNIAIKLDPQYRGKGVGGRALRLAQAMRRRLIAFIANGNIPSMRLFLGNGFKIVDYKEGYYILEYKS